MSSDKFVEALLTESRNLKDKYYILCTIMIDKHDDRDRGFELNFDGGKPKLCIPEQQKYEPTYFDNLIDAKIALRKVDNKELGNQALEWLPSGFDYLYCDIYQYEDDWGTISKRV